MTKEYAVYLHRRMWMDMQRDLGDCPNYSMRVKYKKQWCNKYFPYRRISNDCFLCEYTRYDLRDCDLCCPIVWTEGDCMTDGSCFHTMPISKLLAQPMRKAD